MLFKGLGKIKLIGKPVFFTYKADGIGADSQFVCHRPHNPISYIMSDRDFHFFFELPLKIDDAHVHLFGK